MLIIRPMMAIALILAAAGAAAAAPARPAMPASALEAAVRDLCGRYVALLGEADHGDGRAVEFKVALVRRLVTQCHYDAVFFEGSHYDFLEFSRRLRLGEAVSPEMLSSAIGALWRFDAELAPLVPFLFERARAGALALGGIDDQVGGLGSFYENDDMPAALSAYLAGGRRAECTDLLRRRTHWTGGSHSEPERSRSLRCLADIAAAARRARHPDRTTRDEHLEMVASLVREFARDPMLAREPADMNGFIRARDRSMFVNFRWLAGRLGPRARIIVWAANSHIAKDSSPREYAESRNFGSFVSQAYRRRAFALGFSALSGTHYWTRQEPNRPFAAAAPGSLEALAIAGSGSDAAYLDAARLARLGAVTGSLYLHRPRRTLWSAAMDAIVVFRAERAPRRTD